MLTFDRKYLFLAVQIRSLDVFHRSGLCLTFRRDKDMSVMVPDATELIYSTPEIEFEDRTCSFRDLASEMKWSESFKILLPSWTLTLLQKYTRKPSTRWSREVHSKHSTLLALRSTSSSGIRKSPSLQRHPPHRVLLHLSHKGGYFRDLHRGTLHVPVLHRTLDMNRPLLPLEEICLGTLGTPSRLPLMEPL